MIAAVVLREKYLQSGLRRRTSAKNEEGYLRQTQGQGYEIPRKRRALVGNPSKTLISVVSYELQSIEHAGEGRRETQGNATLDATSGRPENATPLPNSPGTERLVDEQVVVACRHGSSRERSTSEHTSPRVSEK